MRAVWRTGLAAAAWLAVGLGTAAGWYYEPKPEPYSNDRSVIIERSPVDPWPIERHYSGRLPPCEDSWALTRIQWYFGQKEFIYWRPALAIQGFSDVREVAYRPWGYGKIPRRYCEAKAYVSDGKVRRVYYSIIEDAGFAGYGTGVEWCVHGLDRGWSYAPNCKMARP